VGVFQMLAQAWDDSRMQSDYKVFARIITSPEKAQI
jgi:hypothetical protein